LLAKAPTRAKKFGQGRKRVREAKSKEGKGGFWYKNKMGINCP